MNKPNLRLHPGVWQVPLAIAASLGEAFCCHRGNGTRGGVAPGCGGRRGRAACLRDVHSARSAHLLCGDGGACRDAFFAGKSAARDVLPHSVPGTVQAAYDRIYDGVLRHFRWLGARCRYGNAGRLPLYGFEAVLIGIAAYFIADAFDCLRADRRIILHAGKTFTFALCYLLCVTAVCGLDTPFCNVGRIVGTTLTLLFAKQFRHTGGTLMGALTACGMTLCSVPIGTPMLFLPVTAMMTGFCSQLHNALLIPVFFLLQALSCAVLDSSRELVRVLVELCLACALFAMLSGVDLHRFLSVETPAAAPDHRQAKRLAAALHSLCEETDEVMHRLTIVPPEDGVMQVRAKLCMGCKNQSFCWAQRASQTSGAIRELIRTHHRGLVPEALDGCIRRTSLLEICARRGDPEGACADAARAHAPEPAGHARAPAHSGGRDLRAVPEADRTLSAPQTEALAESCTSALQRRMRRCTVCNRADRRRDPHTAGGFPAASIRTLRKISAHGAECAAETRTPPACASACIRRRPTSSNLPCRAKMRRTTNAAATMQMPSVTVPGTAIWCCLTGWAAGARHLWQHESPCARSGGWYAAKCRPQRRSAWSIRCLWTETSTENFATLDVLHFHADCGELSLYKSGAAATLFCHAGRVQRISSMSFPVGIVTDAAPSRAAHCSPWRRI